MQDLRQELEKREQKALKAGSSATMRYSSPGGDVSKYRKREYLDVHGEEPAMKKVKSEQNLTLQGS